MWEKYKNLWEREVSLKIDLLLTCIIFYKLDLSPSTLS